jgi:co-chaperonin GroES (HSP10)
MALEFETDGLPIEKLPIPAGWRILISPVKINETTQGGIVLVENTVKHAEYFRNVGKVVAVGREAYSHAKFNGGIPIDEKTPHPWCKVGDIVHYSSYVGMDIKVMHEGKEVKIKVCNDDEVIAIVGDTSALGLD